MSLTNPAPRRTADHQVAWSCSRGINCRIAALGTLIDNCEVEKTSGTHRIWCDVKPCLGGGHSELYVSPASQLKGVGFAGVPGGAHLSNVMSYDHYGNLVGLADSQVQVIRKFLRYETELDDPDDELYPLNGSAGGRTKLGSELPQQPNYQVKLDSDSRRDLVWWTPPTSQSGTGVFSYRLSSSSPSFGVEYSASLGRLGDQPLVADFTGDGVSNLAFFRPGGGVDGNDPTDTAGRWQWCLNPPTCSQLSAQVLFGRRGDVPLPGLDFDGVPSTVELAVYRPTTGQFIWAPISSPTTPTTRALGNARSVPLPALYDLDAKTDLAVYDADTATFKMLRSTSCYGSYCWLYQTTVDFPVELTSSFNGDGGLPAGSPADRGIGVVVRGMTKHFDVGGGVYQPRAVAAVWAPWTGKWYISWNPSSGSTPESCTWGADGDVPLGGLGSEWGQRSSTARSFMAYYRSTDRSDGPGYIAQREYLSQWCVGTIHPTQQLSAGRPKSMVFPVWDMSGDGKPDVCVVHPETKAGTCYRSDEDFANPVYGTAITYGSHLSVVL